MNEPLEILVVINSIVLVIFLLVGLFVLLQIILLIRRINKMVDKVEEAGLIAAQLTSALSRIGSNFSLVGLVSSIASSMYRNSNSAKKGGKK